MRPHATPPNPWYAITAAPLTSEAARRSRSRGWSRRKRLPPRPTRSTCPGCFSLSTRPRPERALGRALLRKKSSHQAAARRSVPRGHRHTEQLGLLLEQLPIAEAQAQPLCQGRGMRASRPPSAASVSTRPPPELIVRPSSRRVPGRSAGRHVSRATPPALTTRCSRAWSTAGAKRAWASCRGRRSPGPALRCRGARAAWWSTPGRVPWRRDGRRDRPVRDDWTDGR